MLRSRVMSALLCALVAAGCGATEPPEVEVTAGPPIEADLEVPPHAPPTTAAPTTTTAPPPAPTTTEAPAPVPAPPVHAQAAVAATSAGGCPAGGDPSSDACWDRLAGCEAGGNWSANTGNGYYGGLQFALSSWRAVGGTGYPHEWPRGEQIARAKALHAQGGWRHWPGCSRSFGWL